MVVLGLRALKFGENGSPLKSSKQPAEAVFFQRYNPHGRISEGRRSGSASGMGVLLPNGCVIDFVFSPKKNGAASW